MGGTGWVGKIVEPGLEDDDVDADVDDGADALTCSDRRTSG